MNKTDGRERRVGVASELYTAEASESSKKAKGEKDVPDPTPEEGEAAIEKCVIVEDDGEAD